MSAPHAKKSKAANQKKKKKKPYYFQATLLPAWNILAG